jgi:hypothetical protein
LQKNIEDRKMSNNPDIAMNHLASFLGQLSARGGVPVVEFSARWGHVYHVDFAMNPKDEKHGTSFRRVFVYCYPGKNIFNFGYDSSTTKTIATAAIKATGAVWMNYLKELDW